MNKPNQGAERLVHSLKKKLKTKIIEQSSCDHRLDDLVLLKCQYTQSNLSLLKSQWRFLQK